MCPNLSHWTQDMSNNFFRANFKCPILHKQTCKNLERFTSGTDASVGLIRSHSRKGLKRFACFWEVLTASSFPWKQMGRVRLPTTFLPSKKAFATLHNLSGEVICRVPFQRTCFVTVFLTAGRPSEFPAHSHRLWDSQPWWATGRPGRRRAEKAASVMLLWAVTWACTQHHTQSVVPPRHVPVAQARKM